VEGAILKYPYPGLKIRSHIHPKFIIANVGQRLGEIAAITKNLKNISSSTEYTLPQYKQY
jgi:hypothetical protein